MLLIEQYAEARHKHGAPEYNHISNAARNAVIDALAATTPNAGAPLADLMTALRDGIPLQEPVHIAKALLAQRKSHVVLSGGDGTNTCVMLCNIQLTGWGRTKESSEAFVEGYNTALEQYRGALLSLAAAPAQQAGAPASSIDPAFSYASSLATALFKQHYAGDPDYASGKVAWELCDTTAGILTQIDNMVSGLVKPAASNASQQAGAPLPDAAQLGRDVARWTGMEFTGYRGDTGQPEQRVTVSVERLGYAVEAILKAHLEAAPASSGAPLPLAPSEQEQQP